MSNHHNEFAYHSCHESNIIHIPRRHHLMYKLNCLKGSGGSMPFGCFIPANSMVTRQVIYGHPESAPGSIQAGPSEPACEASATVQFGSVGGPQVELGGLWRRYYFVEEQVKTGPPLLACLLLCHSPQ